MRWFFCLLLTTCAAQAADRVLVLNEAEQQKLYRALDANVKAYGIQVAPEMLQLLDKLKNAPTVVEQEPKKDPEQ